MSPTPTNLRTQDDGNIPTELSGIEFLEFSTFGQTDAEALQKLLEMLGFSPAGRHRSKDVFLFRQGAVNLIINCTPSSFARSFATMHGTSVCAMAVQVSDAHEVHDFAIQGGAPDYRGPVGPGEMHIPSVRAPSGSLIYFVDRFGEKGSIYETDFFLLPAVAAWPGQLQSIDHISQSVTAGTTKKWLRFYSRILGLQVVEHNCVTDPNGRVLSTVLADEQRKLQLIINEPVDRDTDCDRFLRQNFGEGVQHVAFLTDDIFSYLDMARSRGLEVLKIPDLYYDNLISEGYDAALANKLRAYQVMIDSEGGGRFLHAYTQPIDAGVFFEFVQRNNHRGFGRHDVTARLMARGGMGQKTLPVASPSLMPDLLDAAVDGNTMLLGTVGDPETQMLMPEIMGHWLGVSGINGIWLPFKVPSDHLGSFVAALRGLENLRGLSIATPHKQAVVPLLDEVTERARMIGAVNLVRRESDGRLVGDMVDGAGFVRGLEKRRGSMEGARVWLVGTGVEGQAIILALAASGAAQIFVENAGQAGLEGLIERIGRKFHDVKIICGRPEDPGMIDIAINASPLGRDQEDLVPFDCSELRPGIWVADIITRPAMTRLLSEAEAQGHHICPGRYLLESQVVDYASFLQFF